MLLTSPELRAITGYARPAAQIRWLRGRGWPFEIDGRGRPVVLRAVAVARLGGGGHNHAEPSLRLGNHATTQA